MSVTVHVIFMGLIGLVPQEGMTALMVDPSGDNEHVPYIFLLEGECNPVGESTCSRYCDQFGEVPKLCWQLDKEDLKILGNQTLLTFDRTGYQTIFGNPKEVPRWKWQANDYSWVPGIEILTGGYGKIRDSCLADGEPCGLVRARMRLRGGHATACHLIHDVSDARETGRKRNVINFPYQIGDRELHQAVADAARVEFQVEGDEVYLHSWSFDKDGGQEPHKDSVILKPENPGRPLTLIITNFPLHEHSGSNFHAEILFDLLALAPPERPTRKDCAEYDCPRLPRYPGSCEQEAAQIEELFEGHDYIHSRTFCDGMSFQQ